MLIMSSRDDLASRKGSVLKSWFRQHLLKAVNCIGWLIFCVEPVAVVTKKLLFVVNKVIRFFIINQTFLSFSLCVWCWLCPTCSRDNLASGKGNVLESCFRQHLLKAVHCIGWLIYFVQNTWQLSQKVASWVNFLFVKKVLGNNIHLMQANS